MYKYNPCAYLKNLDMNMQLIQKIQKKFQKKVPVFKAGATVRVHQRIKEGGKERIQIFEGLVIAVNSGSGPDKTFTVRKMVGNVGVEKIFPLYSKNITKIQVTKSSDVRRSKLYYMRKRAGKSARLKETQLTEKDVLMEEHEDEEATASQENAEKTEETAAEESGAEEAQKETEEESAEESKEETSEESPEETSEKPEQEVQPAGEPAEAKDESK
jgi:large subunit ribosomal protein L19